MYKTRRIEAAKNGEVRYQGAPCKHGHDGTRWTSNNACVHCIKNYRNETEKMVRDLLAKARAQSLQQA